MEKLNFTQKPKVGFTLLSVCLL